MGSGEDYQDKKWELLTSNFAFFVLNHIPLWSRRFEKTSTSFRCELLRQRNMELYGSLGNLGNIGNFQLDHRHTYIRTCRAASSQLKRSKKVST